jgi:uncharacterized LabA/DUF88 family protein
MNARYVVLLDGGFVTKRLRRQLGRFPSASDVMELCARIATHPALAGRERLRIHFYDAPPADSRIVNPFDGHTLDLAATSLFREASSLHDTLALMPDMALRMGEVAVRGWRLDPGIVKSLAKSPRPVGPEDLVPDIEQKGVDLRIGLDIARLSLGRLVDTIVVVSADSDLVPAFRFARREGVRVLLDPLGANFARRELLVHADRVL